MPALAAQLAQNCYLLSNPVIRDTSSSSRIISRTAAAGWMPGAAAESFLISMTANESWCGTPVW